MAKKRKKNRKPLIISLLVLGLVVYLGLVLFVTIKIFDKKELEF